MTEEIRSIEIMSQSNLASGSTPSSPLGQVDLHIDDFHGDTTTTNSSSTTDTNTVRAIIDQAELDELSKFSDDAFKIATDPYYEVLNDSNELIADEIINKLDDGQSGEALQIFRDWKHQYLDALIVEKWAGNTCSRSEVEDYADDFEDLVETYQTDCEEVEQGLEKLIESSEESEDEDFGIVVSGIPAGQTTFSPAQFDAIASGEFYDFTDTAIGAPDTSDEEQHQHTEHVFNAVDEALSGVVTTELSRSSFSPKPDIVITLYCGIDPASIDAGRLSLFDDDDATAGAIDPGRRNPGRRSPDRHNPFTPLRPCIIVTCSDLEDGTPNQLPFMKTTTSHNIWCECVPCTMRKMKLNELMNEAYQYSPVRHIHVGSPAPGLPGIVVDDFDQERIDVESCMPMYNIAPISRADYIRNPLQQCKYPGSHNRISEVEEESDNTSCLTVSSDDSDCTSGSHESGSRSTVGTGNFGDDHSYSGEESVAGQAPELMSLVKQASSPNVPQDTKVRSSDESPSYFDRIVTLTWVSLLLVMFVPKWILAGALVGLLMSRR